MNPVSRYPRHNSMSKLKIYDKAIVGSWGSNEICVRVIIVRSSLLRSLWVSIFKVKPVSGKFCWLTVCLLL